MEHNTWKDQFLLRKDITFLNFGSFGACPKPVFETYQQFQLELEQEPVTFMLEKAPLYLKAAREALGTYLNCDADDVVCVTNPSYAVNMVAKSLDLKPGDEVLATDLEYGACDRTWSYYCRKAGAHYIRKHIAFPLHSEEAFIEQFIEGITDRTRLIFISHLTSTTGLRLPVEKICSIAKKRGIMTFIDGAHGPAQVEVDLAAMRADMYTGACHKWMMAPKGASFLYVNKAFQHFIDPLVISWGYESTHPSHSRFLDYHEMQGTRDLSAFCTIPAAISFMKAHHWEEVSADCRQLVSEYAPRLCEILEEAPLTAIDERFIAQMYSAGIRTDDPMGLHDLLYNNYKIQIPVMPHNDRCYIRYSVNAFNTREDLDRLMEALEDLKTKQYL